MQMEDNLRQVVVRAVYTPADINWEFSKTTALVTSRLNPTVLSVTSGSAALAAEVRTVAGEMKYQTKCLVRFATRIATFGN